MLHSITITLTHVDHVMGSNVNPCLGRFLCSFFWQHFHIPPYIRFWPSLVKVTGTMTTTHAKKILMGNRLVDFIFRSVICQQRYRSKIKWLSALQGKLPGGGRLVFQGGYHPRKTKHVIRVVFQDQAMYARTSFRGAKTSKIGKKGVFLAMVINFGKRWRKIKKKHAKTRI